MKKEKIKIEKSKCDFKDCPTLSKIGITLSNEAPYYAFPEMEKGQWMHLECYIRHCIKQTNLNKI